MAAIKKSQLYSSLWESSNALRGGMDASQYKDYILTLLFVKYVTDKFKGELYSDIEIPEGGSFDDMVAILGNKEKSKNIGEEMDKIIAKLAEANNLRGVIDNAHFNDEVKLGKGQEMVDKLTKLINIFRREELNFKNNRTDGDDIIGDAYEYLMRKFATESGKSKGQFYTPAEVSRVLAKVIGISNETNSNATVYDPACGSGSLLIRALDESPIPLAGYGQEKDNTTAGLAIMNTVLHGKATTVIKSDNTFSNPQYFEDNNTKEELKRFDYIVANPPFSTKNWTDGLKEYGRFDDYALPPEKNGDYAWLLHIIKSLKSTGKAAVILPHGVLFRGNTEAEIREKIIDKGYIKGIISLPANLFYGTGIPACIIVIDKSTADTRDSIFIIDASKDYIKDGNKNRLREQDVYKIVNTFVNEIDDDPKYARKVPISEIKSLKNNYNLNIPRYVDSSDKEDMHDINAHMNGGIPKADIDALENYWIVLSDLKNKLVTEYKKGYYKLNIPVNEVNKIIATDKQFEEYSRFIDDAFLEWKDETIYILKSLKSNIDVKELIVELSHSLVEKFESIELIDKYDVYQVLLGYWQEVMADDVYLVSRGGYELGNEIDFVYKTKKVKENGEEKEIITNDVKSWEGKLIPKSLVISKYFHEQNEALNNVSLLIQEINGKIEELIENTQEGSELFDLIGEDGKLKDNDVKDKIDELRSHIKSKDIDELLSLIDVKIIKKEINTYLSLYPSLKYAIADNESITKTSIKKAISYLKENLPLPEQYQEDYNELINYTNLKKQEKELNDTYKKLQNELDKLLIEKYANLTLDEVKELLINKKWMCSIYEGVENLFCLIGKDIANKLINLHNRYESTLGDIDSEINTISNELKTLLCQLDANEFDTAGINELISLLNGDKNEK